MACACAPSVFLCQDDANCPNGQCEASGFCSFPDPACDSGRIASARFWSTECPTAVALLALGLGPREQKLGHRLDQVGLLDQLGRVAEVALREQELCFGDQRLRLWIRQQLVGTRGGHQDGRQNDGEELVQDHGMRSAAPERVGVGGRVALLLLGLRLGLR